MLKEKIDYTFVVQDSSDFYSLRLLKGSYENVIYTYGAVSISEDGEQATLKFDFRVEDSAGHEDLDNDVEFKTHIGDILRDILLAEVGKIGKIKENNSDESTNDNT